MTNWLAGWLTNMNVVRTYRQTYILTYLHTYLIHALLKLANSFILVTITRYSLRRMIIIDQYSFHN